MKLWLAAAVLVLTTGAATAEPIAVTTVPVASFETLGNAETFGPFTWRGGLSLESSSEDFGGLSGLVMGENCEDLIAISDQGRWFKARLTYDGSGKLSGLNGPQLEYLLDSKGKPQRNKVWADAESLTPLGKGKIGVAYERRVRFGSYDIKAKGFKANFNAIAHPPAIDNGPENGEVESFGVLPSGSYIAISERQRDADGNLRGWIWRGAQVTSFVIAPLEKFNITDLAVLADGTVLTMERRFNRTSLPGMAIRRFSPDRVTSGMVVKPELLLEATVPLYQIDNMEGIAVCERGGETRITLLSDNNFNTTLQRTLLLQFSFAE